MTAKKPKAVKHQELAMNPRAECADGDCNWAKPWGRSTLSAAKLHVTTTGHDVQVIRESRALYVREGDGS